eukprot:14282821-Heterocapsa_arctica.AAC.1
MWQCGGVAGYSMIGVEIALAPKGDAAWKVDIIFYKYWLDWAAHRGVVPVGTTSLVPSLRCWC